MSVTSEYLVLGAGSRIHITLPNLHRKHMKVLCLVTERIHTPTVDVRFDETNGSQREHLPNVLDEASPSESIKLMGTGEIIPTEEQAEEEIVIPAPNQHEDNAQPEDNAEAEDSNQQEQSLWPVHPCM